MKPEKYQHYKNKHYYQVLGIVHHSDTKEKMVLYQALEDAYPDLQETYGTYPIFVRNYDTFFGNVEVNGVFTARYIPCF